MSQVNLDEVPTYIPKHILEKTNEEYCRAELQRYLTGDALEVGIANTLYNFQYIGNIKEYDFCEEHRVMEGRSCIILVWKKRLPLQ